MFSFPKLLSNTAELDDRKWKTIVIWYYGKQLYYITSAVEIYNHNMAKKKIGRKNTINVTGGKKTKLLYEQPNTS